MEEMTIKTNKIKNINAILFFSQAIAIIINILYKHKKKKETVIILVR